MGPVPAVSRDHSVSSDAVSSVGVLSVGLVCDSEGSVSRVCNYSTAQISTTVGVPLVA